MKRILLALCGALLFSALLAPVASATTTFELTTVEKRVLALVNGERAERHLAPLRAQYNLTRAARSHSRNMAAKPFFSHTAPNGSTPVSRTRAFGYTATGYTTWRVGETIAWGTGLFATPEAIVDGWMRSTGHRQILMSPLYRHIGLGAARGTYVSGATTFTGVRYCTVDVGARAR